MKKTLKYEVIRPGIWMDADVTYAQVDQWFGHTSRDLKMDVIYPFGELDKKWPCIVWICGGGWLQMDQHAHIPMMVDLVRAGFVVASVEYRDSNQAVFPAQLEDIKAAIRYLKVKGARYHIDADRIGVMGESAGGHLAALVGVTGHLEAFDVGDYQEVDSRVKAACPWYLPSDFSKMLRAEEGLTALLPESRLIGADAASRLDLVQQASPLNYVTASAPPFLLIHGTKDGLVPFNQSELMYEALEKKGVQVDLIAVEGADHADMYFYQKPLMDEIIEFFSKNL